MPQSSHGTPLFGAGPSPLDDRPEVQHRREERSTPRDQWDSSSDGCREEHVDDGAALSAKLLRQGRQRAAKFDAEGDLTDTETRDEVRDLLKALAAWVRRLQTTAGEAVAS